MKLPKLDIMQKRVLKTLLDYKCVKGNALTAHRISKIIGVSPITTMKRLKQLKELGFVECEKRENIHEWKIRYKKNK